MSGPWLLRDGVDASSRDEGYLHTIRISAPFGYSPFDSCTRGRQKRLGKSKS